VSEIITPTLGADEIRNCMRALNESQHESQRAPGRNITAEVETSLEGAAHSTPASLDSTRW
jgi:hypothetical protein